jgi:hypothetical protein
MSSRSHVGGIVGGVIGGVAAVFAVISIATFVRRRQGRGGPRSILTSSTDLREVGPEPIVTPFDPYSYEAAQDSRIFVLAEQQPLVTEDPEAETPVPVGLSDKELARLRAEGFNPQQSRNLGVSSSNVLESTSSPDAVPESHEAPYDPSPRRLHSEVGSLVRREMERLHAEGLVIGAPPSYREGDE